MVWEKNGTPHTLTSSSDTIEITDLTPKKFNLVISHSLDTGGVTDANFRVNNLSTSSYARRNSINGAADTTAGNQNTHTMTNQRSSDIFCLGFLLGVSSEEKLWMFFVCDEEASGAGTAPSRTWAVGKNTSTNTISEVEINNNGTGSYNTDSNLSALATD